MWEWMNEWIHEWWYIVLAVRCITTNSLVHARYVIRSRRSSSPSNMNIYNSSRQQQVRAVNADRAYSLIDQSRGLLRLCGRGVAVTFYLCRRSLWSYADERWCKHVVPKRYSPLYDQLGVVGLQLALTYLNVACTNCQKGALRQFEARL